MFLHFRTTTFTIISVNRDSPQHSIRSLELRTKRYDFRKPISIINQQLSLSTRGKSHRLLLLQKSVSPSVVSVYVFLNI